jgi:hypothetical protein
MPSARSVEANISRTETIFSQRKFGSKGSLYCELFHRERQEADVIPAPSGMLDSRTLIAASGASTSRVASIKPNSQMARRPLAIAMSSFAGIAQKPMRKGRTLASRRGYRRMPLMLVRSWPRPSK